MPHFATAAIGPSSVTSEIGSKQLATSATRTEWAAR
jgi:hypothetical protein